MEITNPKFERRIKYNDGTIVQTISTRNREGDIDPAHSSISTDYELVLTTVISGTDYLNQGIIPRYSNGKFFSNKKVKKLLQKEYDKAKYFIVNKYSLTDREHFFLSEGFRQINERKELNL